MGFCLCVFPLNVTVLSPTALTIPLSVYSINKAFKYQSYYSKVTLECYIHTSSSIELGCHFYADNDVH